MCETELDDSDDSVRVLASSVNHPDVLQPHLGLFNRRSLESLFERGVNLDVISPRPFAPPFGPYSEYRRIPLVEDQGRYVIHHPRFLYLLPKRLFYHVSGDSYAKRVPAYAEQNFVRPDIVQAGHVYLDGYGILPYCRKHDVPLLVFAHGTVLNKYDTFSKSVRSNIRETLAEAERVLCVSRALARRAEQFVDAEKVEVLPLGADPNRFPVDREGKLRDELGVDLDVPVVLFCGHFTEAKGVNELLTAVDNLDVTNARFVCIGHGGDLRWEVQERLAKSRYSSDVFWQLSPVAVRRWFAVADLLVLPSYAEGRPLVVYEAMASETAVLASAVGGIPEQVDDGETGILVPPKAPSALTEELDSLLTDPSRMDEMGKRGQRRLIDSGWTWNDHAKRLSEIQRDVIRGRKDEP